MQIVKKTSDYTIIKKRSGRFGVRNKHNVWINGEEKSKILIKEGFFKSVAKKTDASVEEAVKVAPSASSDISQENQAEV